MAADRNLELALRIRTLVQGTESVEDLRQGMDGLADDLERAGQEAGQAGDQLDEIEESGRKAGEGAKEASSGMDDLVEGVKAFMTLAAAKEIIDLNDRLATLKRGFEAATGSQKGAADALEFVRSVADRLGVSVFDLSQSYLKITAAAKGTQLEGKATEQIFSSLAGAMSIVGASADDVDNAMNAVAQMMSKGVISAEELRGQLGDVLPGAAQQAAQSLLVTNAEFNKMLESGEIIASEFLPKFAVQLEQAMGGGGKQVETFAAAVARMQNRLIDLATGEVGQALTRFATVLVNVLEPALRGLEAVETLTGAVGRAIGGLAAGEVSSALDDFGQSVSEAALNLVGLKSEAQQAAERQKQMAEEAKAATPAIDALQDAVARGELKALPENLQAAMAEFKKTGDAAAATEQAISKFMAAPAQNLDLNGILNLATSIKAVAQDAKGAGDDIAATLGAKLAKLTDEQLTKLEEQARKAMAAAGDNEAAKKTFAELGQIIEGVVLARFERLGVDGPEALTGISLAAKDAIDDFMALATTANLSGDALKKAFEGALKTLDSSEEVDEFKRNMIALGESGKLTAEQVEWALLLIQQRAQEAAKDPAFDVLAEKLIKEASGYVKATQGIVDAQNDGLRAEIALANAKGQTVEAQTLTRKLALQEADGAVRVAKAKEAEQVADYAVAVAKRNLLADIQNKTEAQKTELALAELTVQKELAEAQAAGVNAEAQAQLAEKLKQVGAIKTAATQQVTNVTQQNTETTDKNTQSTQQNVQTARDSADAIREHWTKYADLTEAMSAATHQLFLATAQQNLWNFGMNQGADAIKTFKEEIAGETEGIQDANAAIADLTAQLSESERAMMRQGWAAANISRATVSIENAGIKAALAYQKQRRELEELIYTLDKTQGHVGTLTQASHAAKTAFNLLGDEELSRLRSAIADATDKMNALRQSSVDALDEAQRALLQQQGDEQGLTELDRKKTLLELQKQLNEATAAGDKAAVANLEQAVRIRNEAFDLQARNLQQAAAEKAAQATTQTTTQTTVRETPITVNMAVQSLDINDSRALDRLGRQLMPVMDNIRRRLA